MNRRNFLGLMVGGVAAAAAVRTFPFRVFSFPKQVELYGTSMAADVSSLINLTLERVSDQINDDFIHLRSEGPIFFRLADQSPFN
ncbi:MAG: hypothetical protein WBD45_00060 [Terriglobales bacterium]